MCPEEPRIRYSSARRRLRRTFIGHVERGENQVTLETLCRLAKALDVRPPTLVEHLPT
jgi:transcriptional regulator with XRE-family HTH domain